MVCNKNSTVTYGPVKKTGTCNYETFQMAEQNCPVYTLNALWQFIDEYEWLWGTIFIGIGFFLGLFGKKLFSATLFIIGMLATVSLVLILFYTTFLTSKTAAWVGWTVLACSILLGVLGGFILFKCQKLGAAILGGWGGFMGGLLINTAVLFTAHSEVLFWIITCSCALVGAGLAFFFLEPVVITATSFSGSYLFVRGISLYAGGFPNEFTLAEALKTGALSSISGWFYLYLAFIILLTIVCMVIQCKQLKKDKAHQESKENATYYDGNTV